MHLQIYKTPESEGSKYNRWTDKIETYMYKTRSEMGFKVPVYIQISDIVAHDAACLCKAQGGQGYDIL